MFMKKDFDYTVASISAKDFLAPEYLRKLQLERLQKVVKHTYTNVEHFRNRMQEKGLIPDDVKCLEDIRKLPFSVKADLRDTYPYGLIACPMNEVVRLHASSGTTGKPIVVAYSEGDINVWSEVVARALSACGLNSSDIIQNGYGYGMFTGGLGLHYGIEALGATAVPASGGNTPRQIMLMKDFGTTAMSCTPSYFTFVTEKALEMGIDLRDLPIRAGIFGAEPWTEEMRARIEESAGIKAYDIYGLSEIIGPGVAIECECQCGMHIFEDHFYPEIIDPDTGEALPDGEFGELVITTLTKYAFPMIRYRTRDLTRIIPEKCACGRTIRRIERISARSDDMFIIRGVNVFPSQIETALLACKEVVPQYRIELSRENNLDTISIDVEITPELFSDKVSAVDAVQKRLAASVESVIGLKVKLNLVAPGTIERSIGKAVRVIDHRKEKKS